MRDDRRAVRARLPQRLKWGADPGDAHLLGPPQWLRGQAGESSTSRSAAAAFTSVKEVKRGASEPERRSMATFAQSTPQPTRLRNDRRSPTAGAMGLEIEIKIGQFGIWGRH